MASNVIRKIHANLELLVVMSMLLVLLVVKLMTAACPLLALAMKALKVI